MKKQSESISKAWNPVTLGVLSFFFTFLPGGIFYAINFERLGKSEKKNISLVLVVVGFSIFTAAVFLIPEDVPTTPLFTIINAAVSGYFIYSQKTLYKQYLEKGGEKEPASIPVLISIMWFILISALFLLREPSEMDLNPEKAFVEAADIGEIDIVEELIERGIDVNVTHRGRTALFEAAISGKTEVVKLLIQNGADANVNDEIDLVSPLYMVAMNNRGGFEKTNEMIKLLVEGGADVDLGFTYDNITPLMWVAGNGNMEGVKYLVKKGADISIKDEYGKTAINYAENSRHADIVNYLKEKSAEGTTKDANTQ